MPDLFALIPALEGRHPLLTGRRIALIGVSVLLRDDDAWYFEVQHPRYWARRPDGVLSVGIGGIGGSLHAGEDVLGALRREVREELGVDVALEAPPHTVLIHEWRVAGYLEVPSGLPEPETCPYIVNLLPPRLGGSEMPNALAIVTFFAGEWLRSFWAGKGRISPDNPSRNGHSPHILGASSPPHPCLLPARICGTSPRNWSKPHLQV